MARSLKKGPYASKSLLKKVEKLNKENKKEVIRTYSRRSTIFPSFVGHTFAVHNGKELDNIANLVKLCPECHTMLKKGRSTKENQIKSIYNILHNRPEVSEYASSYLQIDDINELVEKIWEMLG